ncbi:MAG: IS21-like element helper ATPase IstB [Terriglobales bacterium]
MREESTLPLLLQELKMTTMLELWPSLLDKAQNEQWSYTKFLSALCEQEVEARAQRRIQKYISQSHLPLGKALTTFDFSYVPMLNPATIGELIAQTNWVKSYKNVLLFGPSGVGKTHLAAAIGYGLIEKNIPVLFMSTHGMLERLQQANKQLMLAKELNKLDRYPVIILDDIGYVSKTSSQMHVLFELITHRYETASLIITSNQPFSQWDSLFETSAMTVAAIDRLVHHATIIEIQVDSYRRKESLAKIQKNDGLTATIMNDKHYPAEGQLSS